MSERTRLAETGTALPGAWDALADTPEADTARAKPHGLLGFGWVRRYGGHPVVVRIGGRAFGRRLFVGGRERTMRLPLLRRARPAVDVIVNLCDLPDHPSIVAPSDLWWPRGEGPLGYQPEALLRDAGAVAELLRSGNTVLVHCVAGVNRAPTLCTAVIMLMEHCAAREALRRVRHRRWMAFPDPWHWRALRDLEARVLHLAETGVSATRRG